MKTVVAAALGECVHVAGIARFLQLAESVGWRTVFLGPAISINQVLETACREKADLVGVSYRLSPASGERLLAEFAEEADTLRSAGVRFVFGGTPPVADRARKLGFFEHVFEGGELIEDVLTCLKEQSEQISIEKIYPPSTMERIAWKAPYPIIRHHFGLPTLEDTVVGIRQIAEARVLDVISLGIDQDAQANFFHPGRQSPRQKGAGGVPVRTPDDYRVLYNASRRGNYPLVRTYSGTDDFIRLAEMYLDTINIAWAAVPLFWFNQMDGRGPWDLIGSIREHQKLMEWYGLRHIPVELNEPHHWGMRDASDVIFAVTAYLSAYNARAAGIQDYIAQLMFNSPPGTSDTMDLAKMLAILHLIEPLSGPNFRIWRQTRTGLLSYPLDVDAARAHLSASIYLQMALDPHIVHVVGHTEAHHAATPDDVIEACKIARRAVENAIQGQPNMTLDPFVQQRKEEIVQETQTILNAISSLADPPVNDPFTDPTTLSRAITSGILDAPHLRNNPFARGQVVTRIDNRGASVSINPKGGQRITERDRIGLLDLVSEGVK